MPQDKFSHGAVHNVFLDRQTLLLKEFGFLFSMQAKKKIKEKRNSKKLPEKADL